MVNAADSHVALCRVVELVDEMAVSDKAEFLMSDDDWDTYRAAIAASPFSNSPVGIRLDKVFVNAPALREVLQAIVGPAHLIRELQATRNLPGEMNAINQLVTEYNNAIDAAKSTSTLPLLERVLQVDWETLRRQKKWLYESQFPDTDVLIDLLDGIQQAVVDHKLLEAKIVYGDDNGSPRN